MVTGDPGQAGPSAVKPVKEALTPERDYATSPDLNPEGNLAMESVPMKAFATPSFVMPQVCCSCYIFLL